MAIITTQAARQRAEETARDEEASGQRAVYRRLKGSYGPTYLTILSVVQAVAMADLAQEVAVGYHQFALVQWVLVLNTFGVLIITWNVFSVQSALWRWIPDVRDSAVPFIVGALELFLNHTITVSLGAWLVAVSLIAAAGAVGTLHITWRARAEAEQLELLRRLSTPIRLYVGYLIAGSGFLLGIAWICSAYRPDVFLRTRNSSDPLALVVALISALALGGSVYLFHLLWRQAIVYAQADQGRSWKTTAKSTRALRVRREQRPQPDLRHRPGARAQEQNWLEKSCTR